MRPITPRKKVFPYGVRWRIHYPKALTGGKDQVKDFVSRAAAEREANDVNASLVSQQNGFHNLPVHIQGTLARFYRMLPEGITTLEKVFIPKAQEMATVRAIKFEKMVEECLDEKEKAGLSSNHRRVLKWHLDRFSETYGGRDVFSIKTAEISNWIYSRQWKPKTIQGCLISLNTVFNFAVAHSYVSANPAAKVEKPKVVKKPPCILAVGEVERLMRSVESNDPGLIPYFALILFGGLRPEESLRCRSEYLHGDVIDLPAGETKNNNRRVIEMNQPELATLKAWLAKGGEMPPKKNFKRRFNKVRALAIVGRNGPEKPIQWGNDIMRHSFVSYGVPLFGVTKTALLADHSEDVLNRHYRNRGVLKSDAEKFWGIKPL